MTDIRKQMFSRLAHPGVELFLASFLSLFLELLLIRWVPSLVRVVAYYGNLMLISAFLGLGCGALVAHRRLGLHKWFTPLLFLLVVFVSATKGINFQQGPDELRFLFKIGASTTVLPIVAIFVLNALLFVPLGDLIGNYFQCMRPLQAYSWDLGSAITGTALFGLFSYFWFSPILGCVIVMVVYLIYCRGVLRLIFTGFLFASSLDIVVVGADDTAIWSPYNHISVRQMPADGNQKPVSAPMRNIGTVRDPPFYLFQVNQDFYMLNGTIDGRRYTEPARYPLELAEQYSFPHRYSQERKKYWWSGPVGVLMWRSLYCLARSGLMPWRLIRLLSGWVINIMPPNLIRPTCFGS